MKGLINSRELGVGSLEPRKPFGYIYKDIKENIYKTIGVHESQHPYCEHAIMGTGLQGTRLKEMKDGE